MVLCKMTRRSTNSTANIEDRAALGQPRTLKQKLNQLNLGLLFRVGRSEKVAMVNVFAPGFSVN
jgi:hypothetical protein